MSEHVSGADEVPEPGAVRVDDEGRVEYYDGTAWRLYVELPDDGDPSELRFRRDDDASSV
ncbi:hypothetical protein GCM10022227_45970 [Streptomyces sedi]